MGLWSAIGGGVAGAATLNVLHELSRHQLQQAPRVDVVGKRLVRRMYRAAGRRPPRGRALYRVALAGDLVDNSVYYALVGAGAHAVRRGVGLGLVAGVAAVLLPERLGLGKRPTRRSLRTSLMTVALYTAGGITAGIVGRALAARRG